MMQILFNPNDWLGRHQVVCMLLLAVSVAVVGRYDITPATNAAH